MTRDWIRPAILKKTHHRVKMYALRNQISDQRKAYDEVIKTPLTRKVSSEDDGLRQSKHQKMRWDPRRTP